MKNMKKLVLGIVASVFGIFAFIGPFVNMFVFSSSFGNETHTEALKFFDQDAMDGLKITYEQMNETFHSWLLIIGWIVGILMMVAVVTYIVMVVLEACNVNGKWVQLVKKIAAITMLVLAILYIVVGILSTILNHISTEIVKVSATVTFGVGGYLEMLTLIGAIIALVSCKKAKA